MVDRTGVLRGWPRCVSASPVWKKRMSLKIGGGLGEGIFDPCSCDFSKQRRSLVSVRSSPSFIWLCPCKIFF